MCDGIVVQAEDPRSIKHTSHTTQRKTLKQAKCILAQPKDSEETEPFLGKWGHPKKSVKQHSWSFS
jgi:hypothetical protein